MKFINQNIGEVIEYQARNNGDRDFVIFPKETVKYTYKQFNDEVDAVAKGMLSYGFRKGDKIGMVMTNKPETFVYFFACCKIGVVNIPVNYNITESELEYYVNQAQMKGIVIMEEFKTINYVKMVKNVKKISPSLEFIFNTGQFNHKGMINTQEVINAGKDFDQYKYNYIKSNIYPEDVIHMIYTSGTTGSPKGVQLTGGAMVNDGFFVGENMRLTEDDRMIFMVPFFHAFATIVSIMPVITHGSSMVVLDRYNPVTAMTFIEKFKCTVINGVPTMFNTFISTGMYQKFDISALRTGVIGGSNCTPEIMKDIINKMGVTEMTTIYGLTETTGATTQTCSRDPMNKRINTVGKPIPGTEAKIVDGEVMLRGFNIMQGYYNMPKKTQEVMADDSWFHSGDVGEIDEEGYVSITGRIKDIIIVGGENISPTEIENVISSCDFVNDVAVTGIKDDKYGEIVGAFVIKNSDISEEDIRDYCREYLPKHKIPAKVYFVNEFPMTGSGKVQKFKLSEMI